MKCDAAIADGFGNFSIEEIDVALPRAGEVLVEIKAAGICHTDHASLKWKRPLVMGHEGAGVVREIGKNVSHVKPGDHVVLNWAIPCEKCFQCKRGMAVLCEESKPAYIMERSRGHAHAQGTTWCGKPVDRSFNIGTLSGLALVRAAAVTKIAREIPFASACIVGCGVMTGFGSAINVAKIEKNSSVVVIGVGGVGLNVIQGAKIAGAKKIIAVARKAERLATAKKFGATHTVQVSPDDGELRAAADSVKKLTNGRGADYAFEATSVPELGFSPLWFVRNGGMALQLSGINDPVRVDMQQFMWDKIYITPLYGQCIPGRDFPKIFSYYRKGKLLLDELVTKTYSLHQLGAALEDMLSGKNSKGVIVF